MSTYLLVNLLSVSIPLLFSFHPRLRFDRTWYAFWPAVLITAAVFIAWDVVFTDWGVWGFNPDHLVGISLLGLPIEEWLFFICIPYASVFTYASLKVLVKSDHLGPYARSISWVLAGILIVIASLTTDRLYTSVTFFATAAFLIFHLLFLKAQYRGRFYLAYLVIHLFPFLIVNGILTGSFVTEPVVWYDNAENLSIRVFTIPVEDFIYGFLLYLMNVTLYEWIIARRTERSTPVSDQAQ